MKLKTTLLAVGTVLLWWVSVITGSAAEFQPTKPIEVVVHTAAGGGSDLFARAIADMMQKENIMAQRMQVQNKSGGSGATAMAYLAEKKGETHTIGFYTSVWIATPLTMAEAKFMLQDLTLIARLVLEPSVAAVKADSPYKNMKDFIEAAKKNPGQLKQSGGSITSSDNLARLLIQKATGAQWTFISFPSGGERLSNLLGGHTQIMLMQPAEAGEQIKAGNMRVIGAITDHRLPLFPDVPTLKEQGLDIPILPQARGALAPPGVSREIVEYWEGAFGRLVKTASWKKYLAENHLEDGFLKGRELREFTEQYTNRKRVILQEAGAKVVR